MKNSKAKVRNSHNKQLHRKLKNLEEEYRDTYKRIKSRSQIFGCSTGIGSSSSSCFSGHSSIVGSLHYQMLENPPRSLMSLLQESRRESPMSDRQNKGQLWKVRNNDLAVQEILTERKAALASGKLKGRRLFEGSSEEEGEDICSECFDHLCLPESEPSSMGSYGSVDEDEKNYLKEYVWSYGGKDERDSNSLGPSLSEEKMGKDTSMIEGEKKERSHDNEDKRRVSFAANLCWTKGGKWMLGMAWLAVLTMALALGLMSMSCNGGNSEEEKVFLIPT